VGAVLSAAAVASSGVEIALRYRRDIRRARARILRGSRIAHTSSGPIEYAIVGEGPPLLIVHGAGGGFDQGLEIARDFAKNRFQIIAVSRFGYLRTPLPADASPEAQADAHAALLDELGIQRAVVLGVSAGAPSSVQLALRHPGLVDALVLGVPGLYAPRPQNQPSVRTPAGTRWLFDTALRFDFIFWAAIRAARETLIRAILGTPPEVVRDASSSEKVRVDEMLDQILPVAPRRLGLENDAAVISHLERYHLERIEAPTLLISVADDLYGTFEPARYTAERIPNARFLGFPTGGHLWVGHHQEISSAIVAFLSEVTKPAGPAGADRISASLLDATMSPQ
jgi:pimeloyl-ACP methyl ester carboxylesterase